MFLPQEPAEMFVEFLWVLLLGSLLGLELIGKVPPTLHTLSLIHI